MPSSGIESATLRSLARRSNQPSYAAALFHSLFYFYGTEYLNCNAMTVTGQH